MRYFQCIIHEQKCRRDDPKLLGLRIERRIVTGFFVSSVIYQHRPLSAPHTFSSTAAVPQCYAGRTVCGWEHMVVGIDCVRNVIVTIKLLPCWSSCFLFFVFFSFLFFLGGGGGGEGDTCCAKSGSFFSLCFFSFLFFWGGGGKGGDTRCAKSGSVRGSVW